MLEVDPFLKSAHIIIMADLDLSLSQHSKAASQIATQVEIGFWLMYLVCAV